MPVICRMDRSGGGPSSGMKCLEAWRKRDRLAAVKGDLMMSRVDHVSGVEWDGTAEVQG